MARVNDVRPLRHARSLPEGELLGLWDIDASGSCPDLLGADHDDQLGIGGESETEEGLGPDTLPKSESVDVFCGSPQKDLT